MLHIILLILKIIGIVLAVILGLLILIALTVLFVPIRYRIEAGYHDKPTAHIRFSWLLYLLRCYITFDEKLVIRVKVAMFTVYGGKERKKKLDRQLKKESKQFNKQVKNVFEEKEEEVAEQNAQSLEVQHSVEEDHTEPESTPETADKDEFASTTELEPIEEKKYNKPGFLKWIRYCIRKIYRKIRNFITNVKNKIKSVYQKIVTSKNSIVLKIQTILDMIHDKENQELVAFLWKQLKLVIHKIKPKKCRINLHYGFEDPYTTGQVSMVLAALYGMLGIEMKVNPDFENEVLEGDLYLKGHVRIFPLLVIALRVYTNKLFRKIILKSGK